MRRRRKLSDEDRALWNRVISDTTPLDSRSSSKAPEAEKRSTSSPITIPTLPPRPIANPRPIKTVKPIGRTEASPVRYEITDNAPRPVGKPEPGLDRRTAQRLRRGERAPEARLDLHGMTTDRAHRALNGFLARGLSQGLRCVLVITGKGGRHSSEEAPFMRSDQGVLRQAVPRWIRSGPYASQIVGIFEAHVRHGGAGALYVYLKKGR